MNHVLLAALHYLGAMLIFGCLLVEHVFVQARMSRLDIRKIARIDLIFGLTALVQLVTGIWRVVIEKGWSYYLANPLFHIKITLFIVIGLVSIYPTMRILAWRKQAKATESDVLELADYRRVLMCIRVEMTLLLLIPFAASAMARGVGLH